MHPENDVSTVRNFVTSYVQRRYYIPSAHTTSALYTLNPSASLSIVSYSLQLTRYGRIRALLIDGNDAYVNKRRERVWCMHDVLYCPRSFHRSNVLQPYKSKKLTIRTGVYWHPFKCMQQSAIKQGKKVRLCLTYTSYVSLALCAQDRT